MRILSFHPGCHDASAAAFDDYMLLAAVEEERLVRKKSYGDGVPWLAIDEVLRIAGWSRCDVDAVVASRSFFPWQYLKYPFYKEWDYRLRDWMGRGQRLRDLAVHCQLRGTADARKVFHGEAFLAQNGFRADALLSFGNHHEAHAPAALFYTDWDDALLYTADGVGDNVSYSIRTLRDGRLDCHFGDDRWLLQRGPRRSSLAWAYGFATEACGFTMFRHEGKLTGLAAHGEPTLAPQIARHFWIDDDGLIRGDFKHERDIQRVVSALCRGQARETIAASIQKVAEDVTLQSVRRWLARTGTRHLALSGGLFANVRLNRLLAESCPIDEIFVFPAMGDSGLPVGLALSLLLQQDGLERWMAQRRRLESLYLGFDYDGRIDDLLAAAAGVEAHAGAPATMASELLCAGRIGALYRGRMELGPRALGARSILASPADRGITDELNRRLARSDFMPFAPCVLEEDCARVFEITPVNSYAARFMTVTCSVRPEWRERIPAVIHVDGTARPQVLRAPDNPLYADILRRFRSATALPVLINTSFNVHEEPIVNQPSECLQALRDGRVDFVVTGRAVYTGQPRERAARAAPEAVWGRPTPLPARSAWRSGRRSPRNFPRR
jgi:carbamoyltransferase